LALALTLSPSCTFAGSHSTPVPVPAIAAQYGFTRPVLYETWKNAIDLNNTKAAGFNWYVNSNFPVQNNWWNSHFNTNPPPRPPNSVSATAS
jgi:hypothetical protein